MEVRQAAAQGGCKRKETASRGRAQTAGEVGAGRLARPTAGGISTKAETATLPALTGCGMAKSRTPSASAAAATRPSWFAADSAAGGRLGKTRKTTRKASQGRTTCPARATA